MYINNYFNTTIWSEQKPEFVKSLTKASNKYIKAARNFPEAKRGRTGKKTGGPGGGQTGRSTGNRRMATRN